jgi:drug/metabolite transporter (DMT)-like permease
MVSTADQRISSSLAGLLIVAVPLVGVVVAPLFGNRDLLFFALIGEIGPVRSTVITYTNPAVAAVLGILVLSEKFTLGMAVGFVLVLIGSTLSTRRRRRDVKNEPSAMALDDQHVAARTDA